MVRNANVIKDSMQLSDDVIDLSGQVACIDGHSVVFVSHAQARGGYWCIVELIGLKEVV